ncbi:putative E3 ubiquitin-protein ligase RNF167 precursor [Podospora fimiseda]|uniref:E3 ubiquitin-protein ligase RNF167 n=1 Tax=Podospora fimiseda TaxID=252190 RepID=A0AAN7H7I6_9PEZI|nr:putative E3 ubiquitin-protein ligase RNF167 precursor [Podospora fimiseda]
MTFINNALLEGARILVRQAVETATPDFTSLTSNAPSLAPTPSPTPVVTSMIPTTPDSSSINTNPTQTNGSGSGSGGGGNSSSPLLFFVALGFGVVFTNLWIIVGVKYCFRYNARNRAMRMNEDGEPINMENMPRPHRRRREKKLMPIDEVNEKFPMMKYKTWVASRAQEGLPTCGGVSTSPSRANSIRDADGTVPELASKERMSTEDRPTTSATSPLPSPVNSQPANKEENVDETNKPERPENAKHVSKESTSSTVAIEPVPTDNARGFYEPSNIPEGNYARRESHDDDEEDDDEHINAALPPECMETPGDTCAICIDTLEDDDDVRGLTCGHAFHAVCLDPWLTTRRACCPLCKADYYTPKPRPPAVDGEGATVIAVTLGGDSRSNRMNMPSRPQRSFFGLIRSDRNRRGQHVSMSRREAQARSSRSRTANNTSGIFGRRSERNNTNNNSRTSTTAQAPAVQSSTGGIFSGIRNAIPGFRRTPNSAAQTEAVTPSQLESGMRGQSS